MGMIGRVRHRGFWTMGLLLLAACTPPGGGGRDTGPLEGVGLSAQYFSSPDWSGPSANQIDSKLVFNWGEVAPRQGVRPGSFSVRWTGFLKPEFSAEYTFYLSAQGSASLWIGNTQVIAPGAASGRVRLQAGAKVPLRMEFGKTAPDAASLTLEWSSPQQKREVVPQWRLYPAPSEPGEAEPMAVPTGQNLLNNPGFEGGTGGWTQSGGTFATLTPGQSGDGKAAQVLNGAWVEQSLPYSSIQGKATYTLGAWGRTPNGRTCTLGFLGGKSGGALTFDVSFSFNSSSWTRKTLNQTLASDTVWAIVYMQSSGGDCQFDDLSLMVGGSSPSAPVIGSFTAAPASLPLGGGSSTLSWSVTGATGLSIDGGVGAVSGATGSVSVSLTASKTYILTATNGSGSVTRSLSVTVGGGPVTNLLANGDFEAGHTAWNPYGGSSSIVSPGHGGLKALHTVSAWVEQPLARGVIVAGATYTLSGWGRSLGGACTLGLLGGNGSSTLFDRNVSFSGGWSQLSATQVLPAGTNWALVYTESYSTCEFDDLVLTTSSGGPTPPANPANFQSTGVTTNSISLSWSAVAGAAYALERKTGAAAYSQIAAPTGTAYTDGGLPASTAYTYRLRAVAGGLSSSGTELSASTLAQAPNLPGNPGSFSAGATAPNSVGLSWAAVGAATGYALERRTYNGTYGPLASVLTGTSYTDNTASADTFYVYRVKATNASGASGGLEASTTTPPGGPNGGTNASTKGYFAPPIDWPLVAASTALMPGGKILSWYSRDPNGASRDADVGDQSKHNFTAVDLWDPVTGSHTRADNARTDLFCSGQALTPDGRFFVAGGNLGSKNGYYPGSKHTDIFDPFSNTWSAGPDMLEGRWYPSVITLATGEMLVIGGQSNNDPADTNTLDNLIPDVYAPSSNTLRRLTGASTGLLGNFDHYYPWMHVAPNGLVFYAGSSPTMTYLNPSGTGSWSGSYNRDYRYRNYGSSVEYDTGKLLVVGGGFGNSSTRTAVTINLSGGGASAAATGDMAYARTHLNATVLPDGRVFVNGGNTDGANFNITNAVYDSEIWSPSTGRWTLAAAAQKPRIYHSTSILLPDGRVLTSGGGGCGNGCDVFNPAANADPSHPGMILNQYSAEIYYPPYLFKADGSLAPRPTIVNAPVAVSYNSTFSVETAQPNSGIARVTINKLGSATHAFNMGQHFVPLASARDGTNRLTVSAPASPNIAPPGFYLLFVLDTSGVPSAAKFIKIQ